MPRRCRTAVAIGRSGVDERDAMRRAGTIIKRTLSRLYDDQMTHHAAALT
jgi:hypothetical protein